MAKSAREHLQANKQDKVVVLEKAFAGAKVGEKMYVATPQIVNEYIHSIDFGEIQDIPQLRENLAKKMTCNVTCPLSTSIFVRISAQAAIDEMDEGKSTAEVAPFWRLITSKDNVAKKLTIDGEWIDKQRLLEEK